MGLVQIDEAAPHRSLRALAPQARSLASLAARRGAPTIRRTSTLGPPNLRRGHLPAWSRSPIINELSRPSVHSCNQGGASFAHC